MTAKHTPGPWYALRGQRNISIRHKTGDRLLPMVNVASVRGQFPTDCPYGSSEANARLIAAAPDLAAAVRRQVENIERWRETGIPASPEESKSIYEQLLAALTRATGG